MEKSNQKNEKLQQIFCVSCTGHLDNSKAQKAQAGSVPSDTDAGF